MLLSRSLPSVRPHFERPGHKPVEQVGEERGAHENHQRQRETGVRPRQKKHQGDDGQTRQAEQSQQIGPAQAGQRNSVEGGEAVADRPEAQPQNAVVNRRDRIEYPIPGRGQMVEGLEHGEPDGLHGEEGHKTGQQPTLESGQSHGLTLAVCRA